MVDTAREGELDFGRSSDAERTIVMRSFGLFDVYTGSAICYASFVSI